jgi:hypothetical protein
LEESVSVCLSQARRADAAAAVKRHGRTRM